MAMGLIIHSWCCELAQTPRYMAPYYPHSDTCHVLGPLRSQLVCTTQSHAMLSMRPGTHLAQQPDERCPAQPSPQPDTAASHCTNTLRLVHPDTLLHRRAAVWAAAKLPLPMQTVSTQLTQDHVVARHQQHIPTALRAHHTQPGTLCCCSTTCRSCGHCHVCSPFGSCAGWCWHRCWCRLLLRVCMCLLVLLRVLLGNLGGLGCACSHRWLPFDACRPMSCCCCCC